MADSKITALTALTAADPVNDMFPVVDVSDTTMAASGTTKKISVNNILSSSPTASGALTVTGLVTAGSATITGDLTVDTSTLKVDSTNNRVGIGTAAPYTTAESLSARTTALTSIGAFATMPLTVTDSTAFAAGVGGGINFRAKLSASLYSDYAAIWSQREVATSNDYKGSLIFGTSDNANGYPIERYRISSAGVATWSVAGTTAMTLDSTGLGIGDSPASGEKLTVLGSIYLKTANKLKLDNASNNFGASIHNIGASAQAALAFTLGATQAMTLDASGNLMVGTTNNVVWNTTNEGCVVSPVALQASRSGDTALNLNRIGSNGKTAAFARQGLEVGDISVTTTGTTFNSTSDYRLKEAVQPLVGGLARVNALKPSIYKWKSNGSDGEGFIAHELADIVPAAVTGEKDAVNKDGSVNAQSIDMSRVVPILVAAIQELTAEVNALKNA